LLWSYYKTGYYVVESVAVSSDGSYIAAGNYGEVYFFNREGKLLWSYGTGDSVISVAVSSDGSYIAAGSDKVYFFNREGRLLWSYKIDHDVDSVAVSSDGSYIAAGSDKVYFFNREGRLLWSYKTDHNVNSVAVSSDGSYIAAGSMDDKVYFFNREGKLLWSYGTGSDVWSVAVSSDGSYIAAGSDKVYLFAPLHMISQTIKDAKNTISSEKNKGFNVKEAESLLTKAEKEFKAGDYSEAMEFALKAKEKALQIAKQAESVKIAIEKTRNTISSEKNKGFNVKEAESLLSQAEEAFDAGDYKKAKEMAENARTLALDIDQDGVPNDSDFAPTVKNTYIYAGAPIALLVLAALTKVSLDVRRKRIKERLERERIRREEERRRKEYEREMKKLELKLKQWKEEGYDVSELEEMLK